MFVYMFCVRVICCVCILDKNAKFIIFLLQINVSHVLLKTVPKAITFLITISTTLLRQSVLGTSVSFSEFRRCPLILSSFLLLFTTFNAFTKTMKRFLGISSLQIDNSFPTSVL